MLDTSVESSCTTASGDTARLAALDHAHVWHPFTPMRQWCAKPPLVIERGEGPYLFDTDGNRYIDGVSSLWCNVHGHAVPHIDAAVRDQLDKIAHTTLLGLASPPSIELAARLVTLTAEKLRPQAASLKKVFYSDAGATALEVAFKMAVGHWHHRGQSAKTRFIGLRGAYHGDTVGSMSVGYSDLFHRAFQSMVFPVDWFPAPDACRPPEDLPRVGRPCDSDHAWPSEDPALAAALSDYCLGHLQRTLESRADQTAAIVIEPVMQGAAGMICQPPGFVRRVAELAKRHDVLLIADEVAVGFGRTGAVFACEHEGVCPDILCLAKGLTGGYLPLAVTMTTDAIYDAFTGEPDEKKTLYHGHTYTGNPLACAAALAGLDLFNTPTHGSSDLISHTRVAAELIREKLHPLRGCPHVRDIRQRGLMVGIELGENTTVPSQAADGGTQPTKVEPFDFSKLQGHAICDGLRDHGVIIRPLGNVLVLMPIPATPADVLAELLNKVVAAVLRHEARG
ncbi:MAG: adenosylmethionine--8-amino-7-oxononanoate transaminase [Planctomycetota bacterium]